MKLSNKKSLILIIVIAVIACTAMILLKPSKDTLPTASNPEETQNTLNTEEEEPTKNDENINGLDKPIFMYFVTNSDLENETTSSVIKKLQTEFADTVIFEIRNADEEPELYDNFPIDGAMPMLIMQKKGGDISNFLFSCNDYEQLKAAIEATL